MSAKRKRLSVTPRQASNQKNRPGARKLFRDTRAWPAPSFFSHAAAKDKFPQYPIAYRRPTPLGRPLIIAICCAVLSPIVGIGAFEFLSSRRGEDKIGYVSENKFVTDSRQSGGLSSLGTAYSIGRRESIPPILLETDNSDSEIAAGNKETDAAFAHIGKM